MNKNLQNGVIKSIPRSWSADEIVELRKLKSEGKYD